MTPAARIAAAIDVLDVWRGGVPAEQALTRWARQSRFAGSKDRAAVRDHVFDVLRCRDTAAAFGNGESGRALMLGLLRSRDEDVGTFFAGQGYGPDPLTEDEAAFSGPTPNALIWNLPSWLIDAFETSLGDKSSEAARILQGRAPVTVRVNMRKGGVENARALMAQSDIQTSRNPVETNALTITEGARRLRNSKAYLDGFVELQDAASQAVIALLPPAQRCLDYCAGGGGKALAMAAQENREVFAHDHAPERMKDIALRAARAGATVHELNGTALDQHAPFDLVLCDVPCSGSGAWRRSPEGKWNFTPDRLAELQKIQRDVLSKAAQLVSSTGWLIYATCSLLKAENEDIIEQFLSDHSDWRCVFEKRFDVCADADGFYTAHLTRDPS